MPDRVYIACDLNNAEEKEMPISSVNPTKNNGVAENIGIICYT